MSTKFFDIYVAKEFDFQQGGKTEKRTTWNKVGSAWPSKSSESLNFELFLLPNQRYTIRLRAPGQEQDAANEEAPF